MVGQGQKYGADRRSSAISLHE